MGRFSAMTCGELAMRLRAIAEAYDEEGCDIVASSITELYKDVLTAVVMGAQDARILAEQALNAERFRV